MSKCWKCYLLLGHHLGLLFIFGYLTLYWPKHIFCLNVIQHSVAPEIAVHGLPVDLFSRSGSGGVNLCRLSAGVDFNEPSTSHWSSTTSIKFEVFISYYSLKWWLLRFKVYKPIKILFLLLCMLEDVTPT